MTGSGQPDGAFWAPAIGSAMFERFCQLFFSRYCPLAVEGRHHIPDESFVLCSNHASHIDSAALMTASGRKFRNFALLGASDYFFHSRGVRWAVAPFMNVIPIERHPGPKSLSACLSTSRRFLRQTGGALILYPEGTRSASGEMGPLKAGAGLFAVELGVPVIPAYIEGSHRILRKGESVPRPGPLAVRFGPALRVPQSRLGDVSNKERRIVIVERLAASIRLLGGMSEVAELVTEVPGKV
jgi:1-acyl-sn-glycerol-3-phosphate acyltransferase